MKFSRLLLVIVAIFLSGCATTSLEQQFKGQSDQQIFIGGEKALAKHKYSDAVKNFEALNTLYPFGNYSEQGQLDIIYAYYKDDDAASALAAADRYIRLYPRSPYVDYAYYMRGLINFGRDTTWSQRLMPTDPADRDLNYMQAAFNNFNGLISLFPNSVYAADARLRMIYIRNLFAQRELNIANFYYIREIYLAAANRANTIVTNYQGAPQVADALGIMTQSYYALGEVTLAHQALQVLATNYPNSITYKHIKKQLPQLEKLANAP